MLLAIRTLYIGCFLVLTIYHILIYIGRRKDYLNLLYSLYCISLANMVIAGYFFEQYKSHSFSTIYFIISINLISGTITLFTYFIFKLQKTKIAKFIFTYYIVKTFILLILIMLYFFVNKKYIFIYYPIIGIYPFIYIALVFFKYFNKNNKKERRETIVIIGFLLLIIYLIIFPFFMLFKIFIPNYITYSMYLINALFFAFALTDSFNREHRDLIDLKDNLEKKVNERTNQLEEAHKQKTNLFINLAHETKTPLTLISNYMDKYIKKHGKSDDITIIKNNIDKLKKDMVNYLDLEKLERGQIYYNHDNIINFSDLLKNKIKLFKEIAWKKNIVIKSDLTEDIYIKIDPYAIDRIINNLIDNAIKYTNNKGQINISLTLNKNNIEFIISDTGIGISEEQLKHILEPYHQISHKKRNIQGIGMGLNIVKKVLDTINGKIVVESKINQGTTFKLYFELQKVKDNEKINTEYTFSQPTDIITDVKFKEEVFDVNKKNILIVEDNIQMLSFLQESLLEYYNVFTAKDGNEALNIIDDIPSLNLIVSDVMMDKMDGHEFYDELKKNPNYQSIPFIFLTAKTSTDEKLEALKKGAIDYINKPFVISELINKINSLLSIQENQKLLNIDNINNLFSKILNEELEENNETANFDKICIEYKIKEVEKDIIKLLIDGAEYKQISKKLDISISSVKKRIHNIYKKLNINNKIELINLFVL